MDTVAVLCDGNPECHANWDERRCSFEETDEYDFIVYAMTAGTTMFYVVLKLVWWFYQRHQPVGDEDEDDEEEVFELTEIVDQEIAE